MYVSTNQKDWDEHLPQVLFAYRVSPNATTGESPFYLLYGREPRLPMDVSLLPPTNLSPSVAKHRARIVTTLEEVKQLIQSNTQRAQLKMKARYDQSARQPPYTIGQRVFLHQKTLRTLENKLVHAPVHANRLKPYFDPKDRPIEAPQEDPDMDSEPYLHDHDIPADSFPSCVSHVSTNCPPLSHSNDAPATGVTTSAQENVNHIYDAEQIVGHRVRHGKPEYRIKWRGYGKRHNTWEPPDHILDQRLWTDFYARHPEHRPTANVNN
ncbi:uncharacterized protein LOC114526084 [Dendronephthya gigantea]|uniref:uncharacterized protein LOC114526084 n=1 Tax=Dendronephthya gigantea TaxID=151771 RepID=UPI00106AE0E5|nr:uncharacterized protein LOC114526084 [Dendronephthya gigantea]